MERNHWTALAGLAFALASWSLVGCSSQEPETSDIGVNEPPAASQGPGEHRAPAPGGDTAQSTKATSVTLLVKDMT